MAVLDLLRLILVLVTLYAGGDDGLVVATASWGGLDSLVGGEHLDGVLARGAERPAMGDDPRWTRITFYACIPGGYCHTTASGVQVAEGMAACDPSRLGQRFRIEGDPTGRTYTCTDTGNFGGQWVDVWHYRAEDGWRWQAQVGSWAWVEWQEGKLP